MVPTCWMKEGFVIMWSHWNFWQIGSGTSLIFRNYSIVIWDQKKEAIIYKVGNQNRLTKFVKLILAFIFHFWSNRNAGNQIYLLQIVRYMYFDQKLWHKTQFLSYLFFFQFCKKKNWKITTHKWPFYDHFWPFCCQFFTKLRFWWSF